MSLRQEFKIAVQASQPVLRIDTDEVYDAVHSIGLVCKERQWEMMSWDAVQSDSYVTPAELEKGTRVAVPKQPKQAYMQLIELLNSAKKEVPVVLVVHNFHLLTGDQHRAFIAVLVQILSNFGRKDNLYLAALMPPDAKLPPELAQLFHRIVHELPDAAELGQMLDEMETSDGRPTYKTPADRQRIIDSARGMTRLQAEGAFAASFVEHGLVNPKDIWEQKATMLNQDGLVELKRSNLMFADVAGLDGLKDFLARLMAPHAINDADPDVRAKGVCVVGPPGCLHGDTLIYDPVDGSEKTVKERYQSGKAFHVWAMDKTGGFVIAAAEAPWCYPVSRMVETVFESGRSLVTTEGHRYWTGEAWTSVAEVSAKLRSGELVRLPTISERDLRARSEDALRYWQTTASCLDDCSYDRDLRDARLLGVAGAVRAYVPSRVDALPHNRFLSHAGVPDEERTSTLSEGCDHRSMPDCSRPTALRPADEAAARDAAGFRESFACCSASAWLSVAPTDLVCTDQSQSVRETASRSSSVGVRRIPEAPEVSLTRDSSEHRICWPALVVSSRSGVAAGECGQAEVLTRDSSFCCGGSDSGIVPDRVVTVNQKEADNYYDFHVPGYENYWAGGLVHHNTGKSMIAEAAGNQFGLPTLALNPGNLMGGLVGDTERNTRKVFSIIRAMAPCVVIMDEVSKVMPSSGQDRDGGVGSRMLGTFLTMMNDMTERVFWFFTENDISGMHEAFMRAERVDAVFYVGLPDEVQRAAAWQLYLSKFFARAPDCGHTLAGLDMTAGDPVLRALMEHRDMASPDAERLAALLLACPQSERSKRIDAAVGTTKLPPKFKAELSDLVVKDDQWSPAEIRACCRLARRLNEPLHVTQRRIRPVALTAKARLEALEVWAKEAALDAQTGVNYGERSTRIGARAPASGRRLLG